jgi:putative ATPase
VIANSLDAEFHHLSAVLAKKEDVVKIIAKAQKSFSEWRQTILFLDEIHRWTKSQQDVLLPWVEKGIVTLIGATTENPSFTVINALLSRCRTYILEPIKPEEVQEFLEKNMENIQERYPNLTLPHPLAPSPSEKGNPKTPSPLGEGRGEVLSLIARLGGGDLRNTLNLLETACILQGAGELTRETILEAGSKSLMYDQDGEEHYNLISAMHKSLRDSDGDAAIYWIGRMLAGGEDPRFIARRMINFASEDIYDPQAIILTNSVYEICEKMGMPECELPLINVAYYLADAPKDNRIYKAMKAMQSDVREFGNLWVPLHLRNAPTELMREAGYGKGYEYAHDLPPLEGGIEGGSKKSSQEHFPEELKGRSYRRVSP